MTLIDKILQMREFNDQPPILLDIGASGAIHKKWKRVAPYSICIAFDADKRELNAEPETNKGYKKLFVKNALLTAHGSGESTFYLTASPYCSSLLKPSTEALKKWSFSPLFDVEKTVQLSSVDISSILLEFSIDRIDWFKSDTQGTDLRLFTSVPKSIQEKILVAEFEPGIIDAYDGEDKLHAVLNFMDASKNFWLGDFVVKGTPRISYADLKSIFSSRFTQKVVSRVGKISPGWGELTFLNSFQDLSGFSKRDTLLGWVFATIQGQHGFALELANRGKTAYGDSLFNDLEKHSRMKIQGWLFSTGYFSLLKKLID